MCRAQVVCYLGNGCLMRSKIEQALFLDGKYGQDDFDIADDEAWHMYPGAA